MHLSARVLKPVPNGACFKKTRDVNVSNFDECAPWLEWVTLDILLSISSRPFLRAPVDPDVRILAMSSFDKSLFHFSILSFFVQTRGPWRSPSSHSRTSRVASGHLPRTTRSRTTCNTRHLRLLLLLLLLLRSSHSCAFSVSASKQTRFASSSPSSSHSRRPQRRTSMQWAKRLPPRLPRRHFSPRVSPARRPAHRPRHSRHTSSRNSPYRRLSCFGGSSTMPYAWLLTTNDLLNTQWISSALKFSKWWSSLNGISYWLSPQLSPLLIWSVGVRLYSSELPDLGALIELNLVVVESARVIARALLWSALRSAGSARRKSNYLKDWQATAKVLAGTAACVVGYWVGNEIERSGSLYAWAGRAQSGRPRA